MHTLAESGFATAVPGDSGNHGSRVIRPNSEGLERGRRTEAANLLLTLLNARFGQIPEDVAVRVQDSSADVIEMWFQRAISAPSLALVFGDAHASH